MKPSTGNEALQVVACNPQCHGEAILAIFNDAILNSTALYDYKPRTIEMIQQWFETKTQSGFPVIGVENAQGKLLGFASYGTFRSFPAYKYTVEHSVYVDGNSRGQGIGTRLLQEVIAAAQRQELHCLVGGIDAANSVSIRLHEKLGFEYCGAIRHAGYKFGRWLDLAFYQLILQTPAEPTDG
jgi:phosphinothricin acetyltransferase